ncbi:hypothetical protein Poli38472_011650 [Pythium oligandrum]|uniref:Uncharacterized protein n=1 Tax=Pythium oligandrum TaxID=41045 RepID=A0A8K1FIA3_PYTOL|nr:hypothetical protein Poli38472_011650 [Pythium oligandrum]|eukprot:TMW64770.1 hypothetical protein Poli38472_011650 [Pythium oligandrum]
MRIASSVLNNFVTKKTDGTKENLLDQTQFLNLAREAGIAAVAEPETKKALMGMIEGGLSVASASGPYGSGIKTLIVQIQDLVVSARQKSPKETADKMKEAVMGTDIMVKSVPDVAEKCFNAKMPNALKNRDQFVATIHAITDSIIETLEGEESKRLTPKELVFSVAELGLNIASVFDTTGITGLFAQATCEPTSITTPIQFGPGDAQLGPKTVNRAFEGSSGEWLQAKSNVVQATFTSKDSEDVEVVIYSGGYDYKTVQVPKASTIE